MDINAPAAWAVTTGGAGEIIALLDTEVDVDHPDLESNIWVNPAEVGGNQIDDDGNGLVDDVNGWDFVDGDAWMGRLGGSQHGTHMAGTIAAVGDNGIGTTGIAWRAKIIVLRVLDTDGNGWASDAAAAVEYAAAASARLVNASWTAKYSSMALRDVIAAAELLVLAAAGNDAADADGAPAYPAAENLENVVSVTGLDRLDELSCFANWGATSVDVGAPAVEILAPVPGAEYARMSGTSCATAFATGVAALVQARFPELPPVSVRAALLDTVTPVQALMGKSTTGGRLNAFDAVGCDDECHSDAHCDDAKPCNGTEYCESGACVAGTAPECPASTEACISSACSDEGGGCVLQLLADGSSCSDADACNGLERCQGGVCTDGGAPNCEIDDPCLVGACDEMSGCVAVPIADDTPCPDADPCDGAERCQGGECEDAPPLNCDDGDPCTTDDCDVDGCTHAVKPDGAACADAEPCDGTEQCIAGECLPGTPLECDDVNPCTADACIEGRGCSYEPVSNWTPCGVGDVCNGGDVCVGGDCEEVPPTNCSDGDPCTSDSCDMALGCVFVPRADGFSCGDGEPCNGQEHCVAGACDGVTPVNCEDNNPCTVDACEPGHGCSHDTVNDGVVCGDADACHEAAVCDEGSCIADAIDCDDGNLCTIDACGVQGCTYENASDGTLCDDGNLCNGGEQCDGGACTEGATLDCADADPCTADFCAPQHGCVTQGLCGEPFVLEPALVTEPSGEVIEASEALADEAVAAPIVILESGEANVWSCTFEDLEGGTVFSPAVLVDLTQGIGAEGIVHIEVACGGTILAALALDIAELAQFDGFDFGIIPTQIVVPIPAAAENLSLLNCAGVEIWIEGAGIGPLYWSYAGLVGQIADAPPQACAADAECDDAVVCNGTETCVVGWCQPGTEPDCSALADACNFAFCSEPVQQCVAVPLPDPSCDPAWCGDSIIQASLGEQCDHGFTNANDGACTSACSVATCGDGLLWAGVEACDDGNAVDGDGCDTDCSAGPVIVGTFGTGREHTCTLTTTDEVRCWGNGLQGKLGNGSSAAMGDNEAASFSAPVALGIPAQQVAVGGWHACAVGPAGEVRCWGSNLSSALGYPGVGDVGTSLLPEAVGNVDVGAAVTQIDAGEHHTCVVTDMGNVRCWGEADRGRLGYADLLDVGDNESPAAKGDVSLGGTVVQVASGREHNCALLDVGAVRCWGRGTHGQLGYGNTDDIGDDEHPVTAGEVDLGGDAVLLAAGDFHSCALLDTGGVRCWGSGVSGRLGYGEIANVGDDETPAMVGDIALGGSALEIAAGFAHTCAVLDGGAVFCWGGATNGQLGYGNVDAIGDNELPIAAGAVDVGAVVVDLVADEHTCARAPAGELHCWGRGHRGQLGYASVVNVGDDETPASVGNVPY